MNKTLKFVLPSTGDVMPAWRNISRTAKEIIRHGDVEVSIKIKQDSRTIAQNARMWAMLEDISRQVKWPVDGELVNMSAEDWKHVFTAGLTHEQRVAAGINGGFVMLGTKTSKMSKKDMTDLQTLIDAFGSERGVSWSDPEYQSFLEQYKS